MTDSKTTAKIAGDKIAKLSAEFMDIFPTMPTRAVVDQLISKVLDASHDAHEQILREQFEAVLMTAAERQLVDSINVSRGNFRRLFGSQCIPADSGEYEMMRDFDRLADAQINMVLARVGRRSMERGDGK